MHRNYSRIKLSTRQYPPGILLLLPLAPTSHIIALLEGSLRAVGAEIDGLVLLTSAMPAFLCSVGPAYISINIPTVSVRIQGRVLTVRRGDIRRLLKSAQVGHFIVAEVGEVEKRCNQCVD